MSPVLLLHPADGLPRCRERGFLKIVFDVFLDEGHQGADPQAVAEVFSVWPSSEVSLFHEPSWKLLSSYVTSTFIARLFRLVYHATI